MEISNTATSVTLLGRLAGGDASEAAWQQFVARYGPCILHWCRQKGCPEAELEDVLQEVLVKLMRSFTTFKYDPRHKFRAWLATVTRNAVVDLMRSPRFRQRASGDTDAQRAIDNVAVEDELSAAINAEFERELFDQACVVVRERVQPLTWQAFALTEIDGIAPKDAADQLAMPIANVYVAKKRVLAHLRKEVARLQAELDGVPS